MRIRTAASCIEFAGKLFESGACLCLVSFFWRPVYHSSQALVWSALHSSQALVWSALHCLAVAALVPPPHTHPEDGAGRGLAAASNRIAKKKGSTFEILELQLDGLKNLV